MDFCKPSAICTERLALRGLQDRDREKLIALLTHPQVGKTYMVPELATREAAVALAQRLKGLSDDGSRCFYGIYWEDRLVGIIHSVDSTDTQVELGYAIHPDYWGRGFATEALRGAMEALLSLGIPMVTAGAFADHAASIRCMVKCGMTKLEQEETLHYLGADHRCVYYGKRQ